MGMEKADQGNVDSIFDWSIDWSALFHSHWLHHYHHTDACVLTAYWSIRVYWTNVIGESIGKRWLSRLLNYISMRAWMRDGTEEVLLLLSSTHGAFWCDHNYCINIDIDESIDEPWWGDWTNAIVTTETIGECIDGTTKYIVITFAYWILPVIRKTLMIALFIIDLMLFDCIIVTITFNLLFTKYLAYLGYSQLQMMMQVLMENRIMRLRVMAWWGWKWWTRVYILEETTTYDSY